jgi:hypothetical protein
MLSLSTAFAQTPPQEFKGTTVQNMTSDVDRMISYRHQEHSWQTSDGHIHVMVNTGVSALGVIGGGNGLTLFSSPDYGATWTQGPILANTGVYSTSDGVLVGNNLNLVYSTNRSPGGDGGSIQFVVLSYDAQNGWTLGTPETVFDASANNNTVVGLDPSIAIDQHSQPRIWCAFVTENIGSSPSYPPSSIKLAERDPSTGWQDTGLIFGPTTAEQILSPDGVTSAIGVVRSARLVTTSDGIGMLYTVHQSFFWTHRLDASAVPTQWTAPKAIFTSALPYDKNPYGSHFCVVTDNQHNLHLAMVDHGRLLYARYIDSNKAWMQPRVLADGSIKATYPKISLVNGMLEIFVNAGDDIWGYQSTDKGMTFPSANTYVLTHADTTTTLGDVGPLDFSNPRVEVPAILNASIIPVLQQYKDGPSCSTNPQYSQYSQYCKDQYDTVNRVLSFQVQVSAP